MLAVTYLVVRIRRVKRGVRRPAEGTEWLRKLSGPRVGAAFTLLASLTGIGAGLVIVLGDPTSDPEFAGLAKGLAVFGVLLAWAILHFGYAERYAQAYYAALPERVLDFPDTERPVFLDFAYFAFTLGTSFAVSDVESKGSAIRLKILAHSVLAFLYNTAIVSIAIGVITGK